MLTQWFFKTSSWNPKCFLSPIICPGIISHIRIACRLVFIFILFLRRPIRRRKKHLKIHSQGCFFYFQRPIIFVMKKEGINVYLLLINIFQRFLSVTLNDTSLLLILDQNTFWQRNNVLKIHMDRHMCSEKRNLEWGHRPNLYTHPSPLKSQVERWCQLVLTAFHGLSGLLPLSENHIHLQWLGIKNSTGKNSPAVQKKWVWFLGQEDPLEQEMATHSSILAWEIPWSLAGYSAWGLKRIRHNLATQQQI